MKYFVYLLVSKKYGKFFSYVGITNDLKKGLISTIHQKEPNIQGGKNGF